MTRSFLKRDKMLEISWNTLQIESYANLANCTVKNFQRYSHFESYLQYLQNEDSTSANFCRGENQQLIRRQFVRNDNEI